jgi:hypothetical protein
VAVAAALAAEDRMRIAALAGLFRRFGYAPDEADTRARRICLTQVGYISMRADEDFAMQMMRIPAYGLTFIGKAPSGEEIAAFAARHAGMDRAGDLAAFPA